jgi:hypothetical protein
MYIKIAFKTMEKILPRINGAAKIFCNIVG